MTKTVMILLSGTIGIFLTFNIFFVIIRAIGIGNYIIIFDIMDKGYFVQLTVALYRVTERFPGKEPLKFAIREFANKILAGLVLTGSNPVSIRPEQKKEVLSQIISNIEVLESYFSLAETQDWLDSLNFLVLRREYGKIKKEFLSQQQDSQKHEYQVKRDNSLITKGRGEKNLKIPVRQRQILNLIRDKKKVRVGELRDKFPGVTERTLQRDLNNLVESSFIRRMGRGPNTFYNLMS